MKVVIPQDLLVSLIGKIQNIVSAKPAIPILSNILIEAAHDQLILSATDLTISMKCFADAKVVEEGAIALPARKFFQLIRELTSPQIKLCSISEEIVEITSGSSRFKIQGMNKVDFPTLSEQTGSQSILFPSLTLKEMLTKTVFSAARDDSRYVLNGVYFQVSNKIGTFMSTDSKRLSKVSTKLDVDASFQGSYILPLKAVEEIIKNLDDSEAPVSLSLMHDKLFLENKNSLLISKLLSGQYPDLLQVIPTDPPVRILLHREELTALLRQVSLFTSEDTCSVRFTFASGQLTLNATANDIGEGIVSMPADYHQEPLTIAFNPHYFIDILRHSKDEVVAISLKDRFNPGIVTDTSSALFMIMPLRIAENSAPPIQNAAENPVFA